MIDRFPGAIVKLSFIGTLLRLRRLFLPRCWDARTIFYNLAVVLRAASMFSSTRLLARKLPRFHSFGRGKPVIPLPISNWYRDRTLSLRLRFLSWFSPSPFAAARHPD